MFSRIARRAIIAVAVSGGLSAIAAGQSMCSLTCPANLTLPSLPGQQTTGAVNYVAPVPVGCVATTATQTAGIPPGGQFAVGTTTNVFVAMLQGGGTEASCQFTVTVAATPALPAAPTNVPVGGALLLGVLALVTAAGGMRFLRSRN